MTHGDHAVAQAPAANRLREAREELGWTQEKVRRLLVAEAARRGKDIARPSSLKVMYSAWENGHRQPEPMYRGLLAAVLGAPESRLFPAPDQPASDDETHAELRRRILVSSTVDSDTVALFRAQTERIRMIDRRMGARASADYMANHLAALEEQLSHALFASQRGALAAVLADSAALAGWQAVDLGDTTTAWSHFETAKAAAREAESVPLLVHAMAEQAYVLLDVNMGREALALVHEALLTAGSRVPALLMSWLCAVEAEVRSAAAALADCERGFEEALRHLPADHQDPELPFLMLSEAHLGRWRGNVLAKLGDDGAVDQLYDALPGTRGGSSRAEATLRTDLAVALTALGEHDEAEAQARRARELIDLLGSVRLRRRLRRLSA
jgi:transcriptional regulator with XRE-family HTH domain